MKRLEQLQVLHFLTGNSPFLKFVKRIEELEGGIDGSVIMKADKFRWSCVAVHQCTH
jgi:hypothetical protein